MGKTESWVCPNCGSTMKWNISKQRFECVACRTPGEVNSTIEEVIEHDLTEYSQLAEEEVAFPEEETILCSTCGAQVVFEKNKTATICPMCGSTHIAAEKQQAGVMPDGVVPFEVDKQQAQANFTKWVKSRWFAPNKLKEAYQQGKLDGMYIPFWTFDAEVHGAYEGKGGTEVTTKDSKGEESTSTTWTRVRGEVSEAYDDLPICASEGRVADAMDKILPFSTQEKAVPYASAYLSGFMAEHYAIPADQAAEKAKKQMESELKTKAERHIKDRGYDKAEVKKLDCTYEQVGYKQILLPVWVSAFHYNGKNFLYMINGETGEVGGERPYSIPKIVLLVLVILAIAVGIFSCTSDADAAVNTDEGIVTEYVEL